MKVPYFSQSRSSLEWAKTFMPESNGMRKANKRLCYELGPEAGPELDQNADGRLGSESQDHKEELFLKADNSIWSNTTIPGTTLQLLNGKSA